MIGLSPSGTYYFRIRGVDRSGNVGEYFYPGYSVSGTVRDDHNNPIYGAVISAGITQVASTNDQGVYSLNGLLPNNYVVSISHLDYMFNPSSININVDANKNNVDFWGELNIRNIYLPLIRSR